MTKWRRGKRLQFLSLLMSATLCPHFLPVLRCLSTVSKFTIKIDSLRTSLIFPTASREPSLNTREFCTARGSIIKSFLMKLWKRLYLNLFTECKCFVDPMVSCCMVNWGLTFSPSESLYPNKKIRPRLIRARPSFYMISDNSTVSFVIADFSLYTRRIALKDDYHRL